jgi:hypothetical protein
MGDRSDWVKGLGSAHFHPVGGAPQVHMVLFRNKFC